MIKLLTSIKIKIFEYNSRNYRKLIKLLILWKYYSCEAPHKLMVKALYWSVQLQSSGKTRASCFVSTNQRGPSLLLLPRPRSDWMARLWGLSSFAGFFIKTLKWAPPCWAFVFTFWIKELINNQEEISSRVSTQLSTVFGRDNVKFDKVIMIHKSDDMIATQ